MTSVSGALVARPFDAPCSLALTCVNELARVALEGYQLSRIDPENPLASNADFVFFPALSFAHLNADFSAVRKHIRKDATLVAFVFDAYFSDRYSKVHPAIARHSGMMRNLRRFSAIYSPFLEILDQQKARFGLNLKYLPIGVDALRFAENIPEKDRWIDINGYGRQPDDLVEALADAFNTRRGRVFHYTRHMNASIAKDPIRHRQLFWKLLNHSKIALAYSPESCDPQGRFPCSFVGQRWFESLAAGCVIAGSRPRAVEAEELLDWEGATIEMPSATSDAIDALKDLLTKKDLLSLQSGRNTTECIKRHDWRIRFLEIERDFAALSELRRNADIAGLIAEKLASIELPRG